MTTLFFWLLEYTFDYSTLSVTMVKKPNKYVLGMQFENLKQNLYYIYNI